MIIVSPSDHLILCVTDHSFKNKVKLNPDIMVKICLTACAYFNDLNLGAKGAK